MVAFIDEAICDITAALSLRRRGMYKETLIVFTSDSGCVYVCKHACARCVCVCVFVCVCVCVCVCV